MIDSDDDELGTPQRGGAEHRMSRLWPEVGPGASLQDELDGNARAEPDLSGWRAWLRGEPVT